MSSPADVVAELFELADLPELAPRYNIAPTQRIAAVRVVWGGAASPSDAASQVDRANPADRELVMLHWGLIPSWAKEVEIGSRMINARGETVMEKPSFRNAFKCRRCLIVADGFYEWKKLDSGKQPYLICLREGSPFAFAGLWERWSPPGGEAVESCTIITTEPNALMASIHKRMPVILPVECYAEWLDPARAGDDRLAALLKPCPAEDMEAHPVSRVVNNPKNDTAECVAPQHQP